MLIDIRNLADIHHQLYPLYHMGMEVPVGGEPLPGVHLVAPDK